MLSIVCWKWKASEGFPTQYDSTHVNALRQMVERVYNKPYRFFCVTDDPSGLDNRVEAVPLWDDFADLYPQNGKVGLSCYRRLRLFSPEAGIMFGDRIVSIDLDVVLTGDMSPLWDEDVEFAMCAAFTSRSIYNGSMWMIKAGAREKVWHDFDPNNVARICAEQGLRGSDQAWISLCLGPDERKWTTDDGIYSYSNHLFPAGGELPENARLVSFNGNKKPWQLGLRKKYEWIKEGWPRQH